MIRFVDRSDQVGGDYVFAAIGFQVMVQSAIKGLFANLLAKHVQNEAAFAVGVVVKLARVVEIVAHNRLAVQIRLAHPLLHRLPAFVVGLLFGIVRLGPDHLEKRRETLVEPDVSPIVAGDEVAEPLMRQLVGNQGVFIAGEFGY